MKTEVEFLEELFDSGDGMIPCNRDCDLNILSEKIMNRYNELVDDLNKEGKI